MSEKPLTSEATTDEANLENADGERRQTCLRVELEKLTEHFNKESGKHKRLYRRLRYIVFGLTACSSALAGLALAFPAIQTGTTVVIILTTAAIGIATSVEGLRKPNDLWIHERTTYYSLLDLERELRYYTSETTSPKLADEFFVRLQHILGSSRDKWSRDIAASTRVVAQQGLGSAARAGDI
jgi:hypothetical protein